MDKAEMFCGELPRTVKEDTTIYFTELREETDD